MGVRGGGQRAGGHRVGGMPAVCGMQHGCVFRAQEPAVRPREHPINGLYVGPQNLGSTQN